MNSYFFVIWYYLFDRKITFIVTSPFNPVFVGSEVRISNRYKIHQAARCHCQYSDIIMNAMASQIKIRSKKISKPRVTGLVRGIRRRPVNSPHKGPVTRKMFLFDDDIMAVDLMSNIMEIKTFNTFIA